jgi:tRNA1(Val) A37 N6-methylase TrmN6
MVESGGGARTAEGRLATDDAFLGGALHILQPQHGYRAGLDALLLAASIGAGSRVLDVGAGVGVVGLAVARRLPDVQVVLVEREPELAALARANSARNGLAGRVRVVEADVARPLSELAELSSLAHSFDHVLANPPYHTLGRGTPGQSTGAAHAMDDGDLERWLRFMAAMAGPGGTLALVHRPEALAEILAASRGRFGGHVIVPVHARPGAAARRVLVHAVKGSRAPLTLCAGLVLHEADGRFRPEIEAVLRTGAALRAPHR